MACLPAGRGLIYCTSMEIEDRIYGQFEVVLPVAIELINSPTFQRLKKVSQFGVPDKYYHLKNFSRYEHSIGVMILLKILGANEEEQVAGLLHDVSHTAFSHTIDWVLKEDGGGDESFQDENHQSVINNSELSAILISHNFHPGKIISYENFQLLESDSPNLCADRVDYSLREFPTSIAREYFDHLIVVDSKIVFDNHESAYLFAHDFLKIQMNHWGGFEVVSRWYYFAGILKKAMKKDLIVLDDFWRCSEDEILEKIKASGDKKILDSLELLANGTLVESSDIGRVSYKKFRHVNPEFMQDGKMFRLSEVDARFKKELEKARSDNKKGIIIGDLVRRQ